jgi:hypothetical protein
MVTQAWNKGKNQLARAPLLVTRASSSGVSRTECEVAYSTQVPESQISPLGQSQSTSHSSGAGALVQMPSSSSQIMPSGQLQFARHVKKQLPLTQTWSSPQSAVVLHSTSTGLQKPAVHSVPESQSWVEEQPSRHMPSTQTKLPSPQSLPTVHSGSGAGEQTPPRHTSSAPQSDSSLQ